ncbi:MAG: prephenate dehydratase [Bacteroidales bacterium]|nr:prephenate dehydratase [Bacteroidales bacterium]
MKKENTHNLKVAIQGYPGSFHDQAAHIFFEKQNLDLICCPNFDTLFDKVQSHEADVAIMAIENTVAGSLLPNYALLNSAGFQVFGEVFLRISQNLMALPGQSIDQISEAHSHYMAIAQSRLFFKQYPQIKLIESEDTALSAQHISENKIMGSAAIASLAAAEKYGLEVIAPGIETNTRNFTRFLALYKPNGSLRFKEKNPEKASLSFSTPHATGSLSQVLSIFSFYGINLTKIQSIPILGKEFSYHFLVDLTFDEADRYRQAVEAIRPLTAELTILGEYKKGKKIV